MWQQGEQGLAALRNDLVFKNNGKGRCSTCFKAEAAHYSEENKFCYGGWTYRGKEPGSKEELGRCITCYKEEADHYGPKNGLKYCYKVPADKHHEVREGPEGSIFVTLRRDPGGIWKAGWQDPGMPALARPHDDPLLSAVGMNPTTLPNSDALSFRCPPAFALLHSHSRSLSPASLLLHDTCLVLLLTLCSLCVHICVRISVSRRRETVKMFVPMLHHQVATIDA
jgi:hypothetical protein